MVRKIIGVNLKREIRQSRYRTQENFAFEFGAEPCTVSRWLNEGLRDMDVAQEIAETIISACLALSGCRMCLFGGAKLRRLVLHRHILRSF